MFASLALHLRPLLFFCTPTTGLVLLVIILIFQNLRFSNFTCAVDVLILCYTSSTFHFLSSPSVQCGRG